ncbi:MAG TPA: LamG-like jellyroll fold domain-containing protein [Planctomycetota bacterium]|nr:LamG-like jellyroll fold domain-containing protein [Planctomycetota bacterium]
MHTRRAPLTALALFLMATVASAQQFTVTDVSPAPNSSTPTGPAAITVTFSADVDPATVNGSTFIVFRAGPDTLLDTADDVAITPSSITVTGAVVTLDLTGAALPDDTYAIKISGRGVAPAPHADLFGHWALDEGTGTTAADSSGHARDGTLEGPTWSDGLFGNALAFGDGAPHVDIDAGLLFGESTATMWVHRSGDVVGSAATLMDRVASASHTSLRLEQAAGDDLGITEYTIVDYGTGVVVPLGSWVHLAFTIDATETIRFYVNGALVHTGTDGWYLSVDKLGSALATRSHSLLGVMDEVQVYTRVLTDPEIVALATVTGAVKSAGGRILDGNLAAALPSGDGVEGGDFVSTFTIAPVPPAPVPPTDDRDNDNGCGALGMEAALVWAIILLIRGRRGRRLL